MNYPALFSPFTIKNLEIANRIVMAPMTRSFSPGGVPDASVARYYRRRAEGGVGLIITEGTTINHPSASNDEKVPNFHEAESLKGWKRVADEVHDAGGLIMPQLWHQGAMRPKETGPNPSAATVSPSGLKYPGKETGVALDKSEVQSIIDAFAKGAYEARRLGFDGAQFHGAHGYLIDQFFWDGTNTRDDEFGGQLEQRTRFAADIIAKARAEVGEDFPLIIRISQWKQQDFETKLAPTPDELKAFLQPMIEAGIDCFDCSTRRFWEPEFEGSTLNFAGWVKKLTGIPTITVGSVGLAGDFIAAFQGEGSQAAPIDDLITRLDAGEFDLVGVGRALLTDPDWANKIRDGQFEQLKPFAREDMAVLS
ncbi:MAG: NADH:flavin oxidoreductase [Alphaproteobacteria bacterium]|nr:NADH:flavin oxidoreductase [Alphaproteobacteria bacterium]MBE8220316.1 NADH:flavin oxidoreductase [Alphaproteobacteria bacterium]